MKYRRAFTVTVLVIGLLGMLSPALAESGGRDRGPIGKADMAQSKVTWGWEPHAPAAPKASASPTSRTLEERVQNLEDLLSCLILIDNDGDPLNGPLGDGRETVRITGCNVQVVNGLNDTETTNALGNVIIGYNELRSRGDDRGGSHMLVVGKEHNYSSYGAAPAA